MPLLLAAAAVVITAGLWLALALPPSGEQPAGRTADAVASVPKSGRGTLSATQGFSDEPGTPPVHPILPRGEMAAGSRPLLEQLAASIAAHDGERTNRLLAACMAQDPEGTAACLEAASLGQERERLLAQVALLWTPQNPQAALQWAANRQDAAEREFLAGTVYLKWAEANPRDAAAAAERGVLNATRTDVMRNLVGQWSEKDLQSASAWAMKQPGGSTRDELIQQVAIKQAGTYPSEAAALVLKEIPSGIQQNEAIIAVLHQWARHDLPGAKAWAERFPENTGMGGEVRRELEGMEKGW
ncbi:MAG: hypothetical protein WC003_07820 [Terrimicrobiaceae bacterium]